MLKLSSRREGTIKQLNFNLFHRKLNWWLSPFQWTLSAGSWTRPCSISTTVLYIRATSDLQSSVNDFNILIEMDCNRCDSSFSIWLEDSHTRCSIDFLCPVNSCTGCTIERSVFCLFDTTTVRTPHNCRKININSLLGAVQYNAEAISILR